MFFPGAKIPTKGFIGFFDSQITVIPEGNYHRFIGWLDPGIGPVQRIEVFFFKPYAWKGICSQIQTIMEVHRSYVMTGEYERCASYGCIPTASHKSYYDRRHR
jgi:Na+-transporting NADH:ubiquinone oxidoreductase subunit A